MIRDLYNRYLLPHFIDMAAGVAPLERQRKVVVPKARGRVLEVGFGTGRNLPFYDASRVTKIVGLEPSEAMRRIGRRRIRESGLEITLVDAVAEEMPFENGSFDTVLLTFTLCSVEEPLMALREIRRVIRPDGRLLFCEHGRSPNVFVSQWQDLLTPWWKRVSGGCHLNRDVVKLLQTVGFECPVLDRFYATKLRPWTWITRGEAIPKGGNNENVSES